MTAFVIVSFAHIVKSTVRIKLIMADVYSAFLLVARVSSFVDDILKLVDVLESCITGEKSVRKFLVKSLLKFCF